MKRPLNLIIGIAYDNTLLPSNYDTKAVGATNMIDLETNAVATTDSRVIAIVAVCADNDGTKYLEYSLPIHENNIERKSGSVYAAAITKSVDFDITGLTVVAGDEYVLWITDYNDYNYIMPRRRMSYEATEADAAAGTPSDAIAAGLAAAITADVSVPNVVASSAGSVITITGKAVPGAAQVINGFRSAPEILFNIHLDNNLQQFVATIAVTNPDPGCGTIREVRKLEEVHKGYKGHLNRVIFPTSANIQYKTDPAVAGGGYDLIVIEHTQPQHTNTEGDVHAQVSSTVALPAGVGVGGGSLFEDLDPVLIAMK